MFDMFDALFSSDLGIGLLIGAFFGLQAGAALVALIFVFHEEFGEGLVTIGRGISGSLAGMRRGLGFRLERRRSDKSARRRALLLACGGTITPPRKG